MKVSSRILGGLLAAALSMQVAAAADMPLYSKAPTLAVPVEAWNWSGIYFGGTVGASSERIDGSFAFPPPATFQPRRASAVYGGLIGIQHQFGAGFVLGIEANILAFTGGNGNDVCSPLAACGAGLSLSGRIRDPMWTVGGRAGWAFGRWMPYIAGGYANASVDMSFISAAGAVIESTRTRHDGGYIGGGLDWMIVPNIVVGLEYRHYEFSTVRAVPTLAAGGANAADTWDLRPRTDMITARFSYLFNWGMPAPVVARY